MTETITRQTAELDRGYDHPKDRMEFSTGLSSVFVPRLVPVSSTEQENSTLNLLGIIDKNGTVSEDRQNILRSIAQIAVHSQNDRDAWELANMRAMGIVPELGNAKFDGYMRFAGHPAQISSFVNWFGRTTDALTAQPPEKVILDHGGQLQEEELMEDEQDPYQKALSALGSRVKGYTLTIGTANQMGQYKLSSVLDASMASALNALQGNRYGYNVIRHKRQKAPRRHRVELLQQEGQALQTNDGAVILHMIRERGTANIDGLHVIKRFDSVVAIRSLELVRDILQLVARDEASLVDDKRTPELENFMRRYEAAIHRHLTLPGNKEVAAAPISTTYLIRNPKK